MKYLVIINTMLILAIGSYLFISEKKEPVYYVDNYRLFNEFEYKVSLEKTLESDVQKRKNSIDSLKLILNEMRIKYQQKPKGNNDLLLIRQVENHIAIKESQFENTNQKEVKEMDQKIWQRIDAYVAEYAKKKSIQIIFGSNGTGSIMFSMDEGNITSDVIEFINKKYSGV